MSEGTKRNRTMTTCDMPPVCSSAPVWPRLIVWERPICRWDGQWGPWAGNSQDEPAHDDRPNASGIEPSVVHEELRLHDVDAWVRMVWAEVTR